MSKATWGTALGAATGALIGSTQSSKGALIGALGGAAVGGGVGYYLDAQAAELRAELVSTGVQVVESDDSIRLIMPGNITFKTDSADINSSFYPVLNSVARVLNKYSNSTVLVSGHTDNTGTAEYNLNLSKMRAASVAAYLEGQGVKSNRFEVMGMGYSNPIASNDTVSGREQNRRVEIKIIPNK
jgi:outer membrane protein OmpA-like peptidoglycan-associated protein